MNINICYNPRTLLESAGVGWLWDVVFIIITVGLIISFVSEIFKIQRGEKPDFWSVTWKTVMIVVLYSYLPDIIDKTMKFTNGLPAVAELDEEFFEAFSILAADLSMARVSAAETLGSCPVFTDISFSDASLSFLVSFGFQYLFKLLLFSLMLFVWIAKEVVFSYGWGTIMSLNMVGLCFALVIPAFPGQGFASIGNFFRSVAVCTMWPVLYVLFIFVTGKAQTTVMRLVQSLLECPYSIEIGRDAVISAAGLLFTGLGIVSIPRFSSAIAGSEQFKNAVAKTAALSEKVYNRRK